MYVFLIPPSGPNGIYMSCWHGIRNKNTTILSTKLLTKTSIEILRIRETSEALNFQVLVLFSITEQPNNSTMKMHFKEFHLLSSQ